jgi:hypothetical protein
MANENKNKTQGVIKTMQHDLERIKNPAPYFDAQQPLKQQKAVSISEVNDTESSVQSEETSTPESMVETSPDTSKTNLQGQRLEDPALEKLFSLDVDAGDSDSSKKSSQKIQEPDQLTSERKNPEAQEDISNAVSSLRQQLPNLDQSSQDVSEDKGLTIDIGESLAKLKGFGNEMESEDNTASVGSQAAKLGKNEESMALGGSGSFDMSTPAVPKTKNPYSRIDDIRAKDTTPLSSAQDFTSDVPQSSGSSKQTLLLIGLVLIFVAVLGGGGYFFFFATPDGEVETDQATTDIDATGKLTEEDIDTLVDPLQPDTIVEVTPTANIRADIITALQLQSEEIELVEIFLVDDSRNKVSLEQIESQLTITIPSEVRDNLSDYMLIAVRDNGRFEIGAVLELQDDLAESYLQTWQDTVIQDLSTFSLSQEVLSVPSDAQLQSVEKTQLSTGETFTNFYYNYTTAERSTDITAKDNIILIGTTQGTMEYLIQNVFIQ